MHEFSIATQILESVLEFVQAREPAEVLKVRLEIGELTCVEDEQLRFCYDSIKTETALRNSTLEISSVPAVVKCAWCKYEGAAKRWDGGIATLECPNCGKAAQAIQGHDCAIKSIQLAETHHECDPANAISSAI